MENIIKKVVIFSFLSLIMLFFIGCTENNGNTGSLAGIPGVGCVDQSVILTLPPFQKAESDFNDQRKKLVEKYSDMMKDLNPQQKEIIYREYESELSQLQMSLTSPLMDKEKQIIEKIAKQEGITVVVDKSLVVCGIKDITDQVSKLFQEDDKKAETSPTAEEKKDAPKQVVGYLSQSKIYEIPKMKAVQEKYYNDFLAMQIKIEKETKNLKDREKAEKIIADYQKELDVKKEELFKPVKDEITKASEAIAKEKSLIVILEDADILYGGVDITTEVMDKVK